jgi:ribosomal protein S6--L-glutamate ligase
MIVTDGEKFIVGNQEWCQLSGLGIPAIKARVDSGAKTSSIHAFNIKGFTKDGNVWVSFDVHPLQKNRKVVVSCVAPVVDRRTVRSSTGEAEKRYVISTPLTIGGHTWDIEVTLNNRDSMGYRMLLGREAMSGRMLVDPDSSFTLGEVGSKVLHEHYDKAELNRGGLKIAVLASNPELYSNERIMDAGREQGHEMMFLNIRHCYMRLDADTPEVHYRGGAVIRDLDAVIPRIRPSVTRYGCALLRQFETMGVYCQNDGGAIAKSRDKLYSLQALLNAGLNIPITGFANSPLDTQDLISMVSGAPLIIKLLEGSQGRGVVLAETDKAAESVINAFKSLNANILVQEFIKEAKGKDIRCFVIEGKVVAAIERVAAPGEFRANLHQGGRASLVKVTPEERRIAVKAAKAMDLSVAGIDIIRSAKGPLLLEVNSSPGLEGIESATGMDIASMMINAIEKKLGWKRGKSVVAPPNSLFV